MVLGKVVGGVSCDGPKRTKKDAPREERLMMRKGIRDGEVLESVKRR